MNKKRDSLSFLVFIRLEIVNDYSHLWFNNGFFQLVLFLLLRYERRFSGSLRELMRTAFIVFRSSCGVQLRQMLLLSDCVPFRAAMFEGKRKCQKRET